MIVCDQVAGDGVQPGQQRAASVREAVDLLHQAHEDLTGQILGRGDIVHPVEDVTIDSRLMPDVDLREGGRVSLLRPLD